MARQIEMLEFKHGKKTYSVKYPWDDMEVGDYFITVDRSAKQVRAAIYSRQWLGKDTNKYEIESLAASTKVTRVE